jgi:hypothetical protein
MTSERGRNTFHCTKEDKSLLCFVDCHGVCQSEWKLVSLQHKCHVGITWCELDPRNEDYVALVSTCQDVCLYVHVCDLHPCPIAVLVLVTNSNSSD